MNVKSFLIGALTLLVGVALGFSLCCLSCKAPCPKEFAEQQGRCMKDLPDCQKKCPEQNQKNDKFCPLKMFEDLQLTEEQSAQIKALFDGKKEEMKEAREKFEADVMSILTEEQKAKYLQKKEDKKNHCKGPKQDDGAPCPEK